MKHVLEKVLQWQSSPFPANGPGWYHCRLGRFLPMQRMLGSCKLNVAERGVNHRCRRRYAFNVERDWDS